MAIFMIIMGMLFGGFYEFTGCIATLGFGGYLLWSYKKNKGISLYYNSGLLLTAVIILGYGMALPEAVDSGMTFLGFLKFLPLVFFAWILMQMEQEDRERLLWTVPITNLLVIFIAIFFSWIPMVKEHVYMAGRLGGTFQYANTMALYFLIGILIVEEKTERTWKSRIVVLLQMVGIFLSGSRSIFVLTVVVMIIYAWRKQYYRIFNVTLLGIILAGGGIYAMISGDFQNFGRFLTISMESSTLLGRFLYWQDALPLIVQHPFGLGFMGYFYSQGQIQTGVYTTMYVHNELLQILLDIGWFPTIVAIGVFFKNLLSRKVPFGAKMILAILGVHSFFDFDFQFLSVWFVYILLLEYDDSKKKRMKSSLAPFFLGGTIGGMLLSAYFLIPLGAYYIGEDELARKTYPYYTEAEYRLLQNASSKEQGEELADHILRRNTQIALAYDAKALACAMDEKFDEMIEYKEKAIQCNPYGRKEYEDYVSLLSRAMEYYYTNDDIENVLKTVEKIKEIPDMLSSVEKRTSALGWRIKDKPELELSEEIQAYMDGIAGL